MAVWPVFCFWRKICRGVTIANKPPWRVNCYICKDVEWASLFWTIHHNDCLSWNNLSVGDNAILQDCPIWPKEFFERWQKESTRGCLWNVRPALMEHKVQGEDVRIYICSRTRDVVCSGVNWWPQEFVAETESFFKPTDKTVSVCFDRIKTNEFDEDHSNQDAALFIPVSDMQWNAWSKCRTEFCCGMCFRLIEAFQPPLVETSK